MKEIIEKAFPADSTGDIVLLDDQGQLVLKVGKDTLALGISSLDSLPWTKTLTDLNGDRPKLAVPLAILAGALEEHARVAAILNWLENQR